MKNNQNILSFTRRRNLFLSIDITLISFIYIQSFIRIRLISYLYIHFKREMNVKTVNSIKIIQGFN